MWAKAVKQRDGYRCQKCGRYDQAVEAHHVASRKQRPDLRHELTNGVALCKDDHLWAHMNPDGARALGLISSERYELDLAYRKRAGPHSK